MVVNAQPTVKESQRKSAVCGVFNLTVLQRAGQLCVEKNMGDKQIKLSQVKLPEFDGVMVTQC